MSIIRNHWKLHDFCATHGRVIPHNNGDSADFTVFHCADRSHDNSENIRCSAGIGICQATLVGILTMSGIVVEFEDQREYLFCTEAEFEELKNISKREKDAIQEREVPCPNAQSVNPARPNGIKITRDIQDISRCAYAKCLDYPVKLMAARSRGYLTPPYIWGDNSFTELICKDDCMFPSCPFYDRRLFEELRHNHRLDYDDWVLTYMKNFR